MADTVRASYARRIEELSREAASLKQPDDRLSTARGLTFVVAFGGGLYALFAPTATLWAVVGVAWVVFLLFVFLHARVATRQFDLERRKILCEHAIARAEGTYRSDDAPARGDQLVDDEHPYTSDLDIFGPASLFEQLNVTETPAGAARLASWLRVAAPPKVARARQRAARELSNASDLREELAMAGMRAGDVDTDSERFLKWAEEDTVMAKAAGTVAVALLLAAATLTLLALSSALPEPWSKAWLGGAGLQVIWLVTHRPKLEAVLAPVSVKQSPLGQFAEMMALIEARTFDDPSLESLRRKLAPEGGQRASKALASLDRRNGLAAARHNALVHIVADVFLSWDVWCAFLVDRWRAAHGKQVAGWMDALAEIEALVSLGAFAHEHPHFAWPELSDEGPCFVAESLGHPLIVEDARVRNDVKLDASTSVLMVTGSNMSGKSTMLRSMGVAAVLAQAGAPVCATSLTLSSLDVHTSMRVGDALDRGASRFYMEVRKLKTVVDAVATMSPGRSLMFLLDEVLHGTNSRERNIGAKAVVRHLVEQDAIGAVSSHDLGLVELEELTAGRVRNVHFEDHLEDGEMIFDYQMKPGPVNSSNALRLMRGVGIDVRGLEG